MKPMLLACMLLLACAREVAASGADGILCTASLPLPLFPSPAAQVVQFAGEWTAGNRYTATLWREPCGRGIPGGIVYARFVSAAGAPTLCGTAPTVLQGGLSYTVKFALQSDGPSECGSIALPPTWVVEPLSFPYYDSDAAFTLVLRGDVQASGAGLPDFAADGAIVPKSGVWWNPAEPGSGYTLDAKHGTLVVTTYSYLPFGAPMWYLAAGPIVNDTFTGVLGKYASGQCVSCAYKTPTYQGDDGTMTIRFLSPISATMTLPGGRSIPIVPQDF